MGWKEAGTESTELESRIRKSIGKLGKQRYLIGAALTRKKVATSMSLLTHLPALSHVFRTTYVVMHQMYCYTCDNNRPRKQRQAPAHLYHWQREAAKSFIHPICKAEPLSLFGSSTQHQRLHTFQAHPN